MTHILHRQIAGTLPTAAGGSGIEIVDSAGRQRAISARWWGCLSMLQ